MRKLLSFAMMAVIAVAAWGAEVTFDFASVAGLQAMGITAPAQSAGVNLTDVGTITVDGVSLTAVNGATETRVWNSQGSYTLRIYQGGSITFSVENGSITNVVITAANTSNFDLLANVGNYTVDNGVGTWTGSTSTVSFTHSTTKNAQIATVVVTTSDQAPTDAPGDDPNPVDPNITKLDHLMNLNTLDDDTEFQFTGEAFVNYQWDKYLWLQQLDDEGYAYAALVYGEVGKQYQLGTVIPAGWTGKKTNYKGLTEITEPTHFNNATSLVQGDYYTPFDMTGWVSYILDPEEGYENFKVSMDGITLSDIDDNGNFTITSYEKNANEEIVPVTLPGYNRFGIEYPTIEEGETYNIEGMVTIHNNNYELYPISITTTPGTRMWKITYQGENGTNYKVADSLFVVLPAKNEIDGNIIFVTDNVDQILYDEYAEWGYTWYEDWYPSWIALDCGDDEDLYNTIAAMKVLKPETVRGTLDNVETNPRLILTSAPVELPDAEFPVLKLWSYNISQEKLIAAGHEYGQVTGTYKLIAGEPYLCSAQDTVQVKLDFRINPDLQEQLTEGNRYDFVSIFKLNDEWSIPSSGAPAIRAKRIIARGNRQPKALRPKAVEYYGSDYYTNYTICPVSATMTTGINSVDVTKQVTKVSYVNAMGVTSSTPFQGMNIVITEYNDGTRTVAKTVK